MAGHARPLQAMRSWGSGTPDPFPSPVNERSHEQFFQPTSEQAVFEQQLFRIFGLWASISAARLLRANILR